jgi:hypothetical protein
MSVVTVRFLLLGGHVFGNCPVSVIRKSHITLTVKGEHDALNSFYQYDVLADQKG